jgi:hypothetical protein
MTAGAISLSLVHDELFATIEQTEQALEHFIDDRNNGSLLQQAVEYLQQIRGTLNLIELAGAELLAQEILNLTTDIPAGAGQDRDLQLSALGSGLHILRRYLEWLEQSRQEMPEMLLPAINELRRASGQPALPESFFFSVRLDLQRPRMLQTAQRPDNLLAYGRRLRQMYQVGLLGFIREENTQASLGLMLRAMNGLDGLYADEERGRLCWFASAAVEAQMDARLLAHKSRKQLFARVDRELRQFLALDDYQAPRPLLKELLYLVALADSSGARVEQMREVFSLGRLPFNDQMLDSAYKRLAEPGQQVLRSLSTAIREEMTAIRDLLDLIGRGTAPQDAPGSLQLMLDTLSKTLAMVGLSSAASKLQGQIKVVSGWIESAAVDNNQLFQLADDMLFVENMVNTLERGQGPAAADSAQEQTAEEAFATQQLLEARIVVIAEAQSSLALARRGITNYLESSGDRMNLANLPGSLDAVRGGLVFIGQERAAQLIAACAAYIQTQMFESPTMPSEPMLETLADALTSLDYYLESAMLLRNEFRSDVLDLASESLRALGMPVDS